MQSGILSNFPGPRNRLAATYRKAVPAQAVDATLACSLLAGVWKPKVILGR
jgi:hypothetical protein